MTTQEKKTSKNALDAIKQLQLISLSFAHAVCNLVATLLEENKIDHCAENDDENDKGATIRLILFINVQNKFATNIENLAYNITKKIN